MLQAAKRRLHAFPNAELRRGDLEDLPIEDDALDAATLMLVLPYLPQPARVLREAARVLKPGGRLLVADMLPHDREVYRQQMGHVRLGFSEAQFSEHLAAAGFDPIHLHPLPADPRAKGPALFVAVARRTTRAHDVVNAAAPGTHAVAGVSPQSRPAQPDM
jgi:SAM-dependent methyltransferase